MTGRSPGEAAIAALRYRCEALKWRLKSDAQTADALEAEAERLDRIARQATGIAAPKPV